MLRVVLASYYYPPSVGGVERQTQLLARGLAARGHRVQVITARLPGFAPRESDPAGFDIVRVPAGEGSRWRKMLTYLGGMLAVTLRDRRAADVIQVQQCLYPAAAMAFISPLLRRPIVVCNQASGAAGAVRTMSGLPLGRTALGMVRRWTTAVALSDEMESEMRGVGFSRLVRIPNGVQIPSEPSGARRSRRRAELGISPEEKVVLFVGRLHQEKGVDVLVEAWRHAAASGRTLLLVGDGPDRGALEEAVAAHPASAGTVRFCGSTTDVTPYWEAADVFVLSSPSEGIASALLEAMAHGLAVVASAVGGNVQVVSRPELGLLVPPGDPRALADGLERILADSTAAIAMGRAARRHVTANFSMDSVLDKYEVLYRSLCPGAAGSSSPLSSP